MLFAVKKWLAASCLALICSSCFAGQSGFADTQIEAFVERMQAHGFEAAETRALLAQAEHKQAIIDAISRPAEGVLHWHQYRKIFMKPKRISGGVKFWQQHADALARAEQQFGVPAEYILAIIGVETWFGTYTGKWRVLDALATLGFNYPPRGKFFSSELEHFMLMTREQQLDPTTLKGSYAGAMGFGQFISSSYRNFAIDFDGDQVADLWNPVDAIGSVANYFAEHGWQAGEDVVLAAAVNGTQWQNQLSVYGKPAVSWEKLQQTGVSVGNQSLMADTQVSLLEYNDADKKIHFVSLNNFYVITRYNHSKLYALAVHQLAGAIKAAQQEALTAQNP